MANRWERAARHEIVYVDDTGKVLGGIESFATRNTVIAYATGKQLGAYIDEASGQRAVEVACAATPPTLASVAL